MVDPAVVWPHPEAEPVGSLTRTTAPVVVTNCPKTPLPSRSWSQTVTALVLVSMAATSSPCHRLRS